MGAKSVMTTRSNDSVRPAAPKSVEEITADAVDSYDAAARLESQGYGDAVARSLGYVGVFDLAEQLLAGQSAPVPNRNKPKWGQSSLRAAGRLLILFSGVAICLSVLPLGASIALMFISGATGWIWTHTTSAGIWQGLAKGDRPLAASIGVTSTIPLMVVAVLISLAVGSPAPFIWGLWGVASSILVIMRPGLKITVIIVLSAAVTLWAGSMNHEWGMLVGTVAVAGAMLDAVWLLIRSSGRPIWLSRSAMVALGLGMLQAGSQVFVFYILLQMIGPVSFVAVAVAGLIGAAIADPLLDFVQLGAQHVAGRMTSWTGGRLLIGAAGAVSAVVIVALTALIAVAVHASLAPGNPRLPVLLATLLVASVTIGASMFLRAGSSAGAAATGVLAAAAVYIAQQAYVFPVGHLVQALLFLAITAILGAVAVTAYRVAQPAYW